MSSGWQNHPELGITALSLKECLLSGYREWEMSLSTIAVHYWLYSCNSTWLRVLKSWLASFVKEIMWLYGPSLHALLHEKFWTQQSICQCCFSQLAHKVYNSLCCRKLVIWFASYKCFTSWIIVSPIARPVCINGLLPWVLLSCLVSWWHCLKQPDMWLRPRHLQSMELS